MCLVIHGHYSLEGTGLYRDSILSKLTLQVNWQCCTPLGSFFCNILDSALNQQLSFMSSGNWVTADN